MQTKPRIYTKLLQRRPFWGDAKAPAAAPRGPGHRMIQLRAFFRPRGSEPCV